MRNRLKDYGDAIDRASHTCFECEEARRYVVMAECDLEAAAQEREGTRAVMEAVVRRDQELNRRGVDLCKREQDANRAAAVACFMFSASCVMTAAGYLAWSAACGVWWLVWRVVI